MTLMPLTDDEKRELSPTLKQRAEELNEERDDTLDFADWMYRKGYGYDFEQKKYIYPMPEIQTQPGELD